jgi:hypothetical protein
MLRLARENPRRGTAGREPAATHTWSAAAALHGLFYRRNSGGDITAAMNSGGG